MTDIETIRTLTGNNQISDAFISFYLDSTKKFIKQYCNIDAVPEDLKPTMLEITALRVKANSDGAAGAVGAGVQHVGSISDGNQSVSFAGGSSAASYLSYEDFVSAYGYMLNRFRKLSSKGVHCRPLGARCLKRW